MQLEKLYKDVNETMVGMKAKLAENMKQYHVPGIFNPDDPATPALFAKHFEALTADVKRYCNSVITLISASPMCDAIMANLIAHVRPNLTAAQVLLLSFVAHFNCAKYRRLRENDLLLCFRFV